MSSGLGSGRVAFVRQNSTGDWPAWAYAWPLVAPFSVGLALYLVFGRRRMQL